jgi:TonB family protein
MKTTYTLILVTACLFILPFTGFSQNTTPSDSSATVILDISQLDKIPTFKGGMDAMAKYIANSVQVTGPHPGGVVPVAFIVDTDGSVTNVKLLKRLHPLLDSVSVLAVKNMSGHWEAGIQNGKPVPVQFTLPIRFAESAGGRKNYSGSMPEFKGGRNAFEFFMNRNAKYPHGAKKHGTVYVSFIINENGSLSDYKLKNSLEPILDEEALRLAKLTEGKWKPTEKEGKKVKVQYTMPVVF